MKEQLYTIPIQDAFSQESECPFCSLKNDLEKNSIEYTMGPSYMEDSIRLQTDELGFCRKHMESLYQSGNHLGLALIVHTHMQKTYKEIEQLQKRPSASPHSFFTKPKKEATDPLTTYINQKTASCFICQRIDTTFQRYIETFFYLYQKENSFQKTFQNCKGLCNEHYGLLLEQAPKQLSRHLLSDFLTAADNLYRSNFKRVMDDLEWFIDKFDYRNTDAPWKNSKDALPRALTKINGILSTDHEKNN